MFFRVHRSAIVNLGRIREIHALVHGDSMLVLTDGSQVKLSRSRRDESSACSANVSVSSVPLW